jgi:hypothetical protein
MSRNDGTRRSFLMDVLTSAAGFLAASGIVLLSTGGVAEANKSSGKGYHHGPKVCKYGIKPGPIVAKYGIKPGPIVAKYGIKPGPIVAKYGIKPKPAPIACKYGIKMPTVKI